MTNKPALLTISFAVGLTALCLLVVMARGVARPLTKPFISVDAATSAYTRNSLALMRIPEVSHEF